MSCLVAIEADTEAVWFGIANMYWSTHLLLGDVEADSAAY